MTDRSTAPAPPDRRGGRGAARKRTDIRDAERAMASVLAAIEQRWLEREAAWQAELPRLREQWARGIDPDLELAVLAAGGTVIYLGPADDDPEGETS